MAYAFEHCFKHYAHRTKSGMLTCLECGHRWKGGNQLADNLLGCTCPHCGKLLGVLDTRNRVFKAMEYFCIITTCRQYQVVRFFKTDMFRKVRQPCKYTIAEVVQRWIAPNGKSETIARIRCMHSFYYDMWNVWSDMELRKNEQKAYDINPMCIYSRKRVIPQLKRNGFNGNFYGLEPFEVFRALLTNNKQETLMKVGQIAMFNHSVRSRINLAKYWASIKICIRNGYTIKDCSMWCDYIDLLQHFGKDITNSKYVCPTDLQTEHDKLMQKREEQREQERLAIACKKALENEKRYKELKGKFFGIAFTDGIIQIRVLESVAEFAEEGVKMHHCVFSNQYYLKENSLILSATIDGKRIETIEIALNTMKVVQSRGMCNTNTEYHDQIINLINKNMKQIRRRMTA